MRLQKSVYLLSILLLIVFTTDLNGQFRRKKVKLSETNKIEEFINDHIQDPFHGRAYPIYPVRVSKTGI